MKSAVTDALFLRFTLTGTTQAPSELEEWRQSELWYTDALDDRAPVNVSKQEKSTDHGSDDPTHK